MNKIILLMIMLLGCYRVDYGELTKISVYQLGYGVVLDKSYRAAYTTQESSTRCTRRDKNGSCVKYERYYYTKYHPADYDILFGDSDQITGEQNLTIWRDVNSGVYEKYNIGDKIRFYNRTYIIYFYHYDKKDKRREGSKVVTKDFAATLKIGDFVDFREQE